MADTPRGPLHGVRVLDLATDRAEMAGRMLADLGADVLKIEPPGGAPGRRRPPFDGRPGREGRSLYWAALALGKRSLVVDPRTAEGQERIAQLASVADIFIESSVVGGMAAIGLDYATLSARNPRLIYVSVTPYGQFGPKSGWPASDLAIEAAGGRLSVQGDRDRPPIPVGYPQASFHAGAQAATDAVIALNERDLSGLGQYLDTSMQEVMVWTLMDQPAYPTMTGSDPRGGGDDRRAVPGRHEQGMPRCKDGWVVATLPLLSLGDLMPSILAEVEPQEEYAPLAEINWAEWPAIAQSGSVGEAVMGALQRALSSFFQTHTKRELLDWGMETGLRLAPVQTTRDVVNDAHLAARQTWQPLADASGDDAPDLYLVSPMRFSRTPATLRSPAPALDEGGAEMAARWLATSPMALPEPAGGTERLGEAFAGLRVVDFSWVGAGPMTGKAFADHGGTVVRVESATRPDLLRTLGPFLDGIPGINRSQWTANLNSSKLGVTVNLGTPAGREVARRLIDWADVVVESFTPGTMKRLGLDYETVTKERQDLIMLSTCLLGQTGPRAHFGGYGQHGAALSGLHAITGWPDRPPCGPSGPYSDVITPRVGVPALAAAIFERRRSGLGQHIDLSQVEGAIRFIEPLILDELVNGRTATPAGMASDVSSPHCVFRTAGVERFIAISTETVDEWHALLNVAPLDQFASADFDQLETRREHADEIDATLAAWVQTQDPFVLERRLTEAGVPAAAVLRMSDLHRDSQLAHRGFFVPLEHSVMGRVPYDGLVTRFSAKRTMLHRAAPALGEHTAMVLQDLVGMTPDEVAQYAAADALT